MSKEEMSLASLAAKAGMDVKTARKYLRSGKLPSQMKQDRTWRTRRDPFSEVWAEIRQQLEAAPDLQALTIFEDLQRRYPDRFEPGQLRTLQRRIRIWRGLHGPDQEVFFPQVHEPGLRCQSDFTCLNDLEVRVGGQRFPHLLYHFVLTYSNWEFVQIAFSESVEALSRGFQDALWTLGQAPLEHRTDNLAAAVYPRGRRAFNDAYLGLMRHYGLTPTKNHPGASHQNGDVEQSHYRVKDRLEQALLLRGSREFSDRAEYEAFLRDLIETANARRQRRLEQERAVMKGLPARRMDDYREFRVRVSAWSTISVAGNTYSVPSRLCRYEVVARLHAERIEVYLGDQPVAEMERRRGAGQASINYRHVIGALVRKPGAFAQYRYREELFPSTTFRQAYDALVRQEAASASRRYLEILHWAAEHSEAEMESALRRVLASGEPLGFERLVALAGTPTLPPWQQLEIAPPDLGHYDGLLQEVAL
jgi:transposase